MIGMAEKYVGLLDGAILNYELSLIIRLFQQGLIFIWLKSHFEFITKD